MATYKEAFKSIWRLSEYNFVLTYRSPPQILGRILQDTWSLLLSIAWMVFITIFLIIATTLSPISAFGVRWILNKNEEYAKLAEQQAEVDLRG